MKYIIQAMLLLMLTPRFSIRLGTFNVNGKMPSQDLAAWVRGSVVSPSLMERGLLPTVKEISPLSLGEVVKDPFDPPRTPQGGLCN